MIDWVQIVLLTVIIILTTLLVLLGVQVFLILKDLRKTVNKTNVILDQAESITESVSTPLSAISSLAVGIKASSLLPVAKFVKTLLVQDRDERRHHGK